MAWHWISISLYSTEITRYCSWFWVNSVPAWIPMMHSLYPHWGRVTHICVSKLPTIGSHNGLSPGQRQAIIWTNAGILLIGPLWTNFSEILIEIPIFSFKKMRLKESSAKWRPCCLGLNVLNIKKLKLYLFIVKCWLKQVLRHLETMFVYR